MSNTIDKPSNNTRYFTEIISIFVILTIAIIGITVITLIVFTGTFFKIFSMITMLLFVLLVVYCILAMINLRFLMIKKEAFIRSGMRILLFIADLFKKNDDELKRFLIDINNLIVNQVERKYQAKELLIVLPHCLQNSECERKITGNITNCVNCGKCEIGRIKEYAESKGIQIKIATGGTAARNEIKRIRPKFVIAVACERDLLSGITDVGNLYVYGLLNQRPNGPCINTCISLNSITEVLERFLA